MPAWLLRESLPTQVCAPTKACPRRSEVEARAGYMQCQEHYQVGKSEEPMLKGWWPEMEDILPGDGGGHHLLNTYTSLSKRKGLNQGQPQFPSWLHPSTPRAWLCSVIFLYSKYPQAVLTMTTSHPTPTPRVSLSSWPPLPLIRNGHRRGSGED